MEDNLFTTSKDYGWLPTKVKDMLRKQQDELNNGTKTYLMYDGEYYKIGKSKDPERRLKQLQTANIKTVLIYVSNKITEKELHILYSKYKVDREWFDLKDNNKLKEVLTLMNDGRDVGVYFKKASTYDKVVLSYKTQNKKIRKERLEDKHTKQIKNYVIDFGKYKGETMETLCIKDLNYAQWYYDLNMKNKETGDYVNNDFIRAFNSCEYFMIQENNKIDDSRRRHRRKLYKDRPKYNIR